MKNFLKGIVVGFGGISPGLSGSVLLILFGLYQKTLETLASLPKKFIENIKFLAPIVLGMITGVLAFSKLLDYLLEYHEMLTRYTFLGLILGTIPLFYREVKKEGFSKKYYIIMAIAAVAGTMMFTVNSSAFPQIVEPTLWQSIVLGFAVVTTAIVPGIDPAVLLSTLGLYEVYVSSLADMNLTVLLPMLIGVAIGAVVVSAGMNALFKHFYTMTYSVIFGVFLSMIPNILNESCVPCMEVRMLGAVILMIIGFGISFYLGDIEGNNQWIKTHRKRLED